MVGIAYNRRNIPCALRSLLEADAEHDQTNHSKDETHVAEPKSVLGLRTASELLGALVHPEIADSAAKLLADNKTDHDAEELETELLGVQSELRDQQLRNLDREKDAAESEHDGVSDSGDPDGSVAEEEHGLDEFDKS